MPKEVITIKPTIGANIGTIRAAAYCRVSTDSDDQLNSFAAQVKYYTDFIDHQENMVLVDIYADEGITGTSTTKRKEFQRLMKDCTAGKIDRVFVKSVSRFARNSLDCLEYIRKMKACGVSVLFENDGIDTDTMNSELILYVKGAFAQSEALAGSKRVSTAYRMRMKNGDFVSGSVPYGYRLVDRQLVPIPEARPVVELIYHSYLSGMGTGQIVKMLNESSVGGTTDWKKGTIRYILSNEKYIGDSLFQKKYTPNILPLRCVVNNGEVDKYYVSDTHEGMIDKALFDAVQKKLKRNMDKQKKSRSSEGTAFSRIIKCGECGWSFKSQTRSGAVYWVCAQNGISGKPSHTTNVRETEVRAAFVDIFNRLRQNEREIIDSTISFLSHVKAKVTASNLHINDIDREIADLCNQNAAYVRLKTIGIMDDASYMEQTASLQKRIHELRSRRSRLLETDEDEQCIEKLRDLKKTMDIAPDYLLFFDEDLFSDIVDHIEVFNNGIIAFVLKCGLRLKEKIKCS